MSKEQPTFIAIKDGRIDYGFHWFRKPDGDYLSCFIPAYDIYFSSKNDLTAAERRAKVMVKAFFNYYAKNEAPKNLFLALHSLGFRTNNHTYTLKRLLNRERLNTKFLGNDGDLPESFKDSESTIAQGELVY